MAQGFGIIILAGDTDQINPATQMGKITRHIGGTAGHVCLTCKG